MQLRKFFNIIRKLVGSIVMKVTYFSFFKEKKIANSRTKLISLEHDYLVFNYTYFFFYKVFRQTTVYLISSHKFSTPMLRTYEERKGRKQFRSLKHAVTFIITISANKVSSKTAG